MMLLQAKGCTFHGNNLLNSRSSIPGTFADVLPMALRRSHLQGQRGFAFPFAAGHEALVAVLSAAAPDLLMATRLGAGNPVAPGKGKAGFSFLAALNSPNETDREDGCPEHSGGTGWDGLSSRLSLLLHYRPLPRQTPLRGYAVRSDSAPADMPAPTTLSTPNFSRCGNASAAARCRSAHLCGAVPVVRTSYRPHP